VSPNLGKWFGGSFSIIVTLIKIRKRVCYSVKGVVFSVYDGKGRGLGMDPRGEEKEGRERGWMRGGMGLFVRGVSC